MQKRKKKFKSLKMKSKLEILKFKALKKGSLKEEKKLLLHQITIIIASNISLMPLLIKKTIIIKKTIVIKKSMIINKNF